MREVKLAELAALHAADGLAPPQPPPHHFAERWGSFHEDIHSPRHALHFREFVEAVVRLSALRHGCERGWTLADCHDVRPHAGAGGAFLDGARDTAAAAERHAPLLRRLFDRYSVRSFGGLDLHRQQRGGDRTLTVRQFLTMLRECGAVAARGGLTLRSALSLFDDGGSPRPRPSAALYACPHSPLVPAPPSRGPRASLGTVGAATVGTAPSAVTDGVRGAIVRRRVRVS
eukprot:gene50930-38446_t